MSTHENEIRRLYRERPRSRLVRATLLAFAGLGLAALWTMRDGFSALLRAERLENLERFVERDALPYDLRGVPFRFSELWSWIARQWEAQGRDGALATLWIATTAIALAGALGALLAVLGTRDLAQRDPYVSTEPSDRSLWRALLAWLVRAGSVLARAVPEYVLAFLFLALLGANAWPAVLALTIHNAGILGRLGAETIENLDRAPLVALRVAGARRPEIALFGILPAALGRGLLYFFYRFETAIREATVLGMLGIASLGAFVQEARARQRYDEMLFLVGVASLLVLAVDATSQLVRRWVRASPRLARRPRVAGTPSSASRRSPCSRGGPPR